MGDNNVITAGQLYVVLLICNAVSVSLAFRLYWSFREQDRINAILSDELELVRAMQSDYEAETERYRAEVQLWRDAKQQFESALEKVEGERWILSH